MKVSIKPELGKLLQEQVKAGRYKSAQDLIDAALSRLLQENESFDFAPGELRALVDEGEADLQRGDHFTLEEVRKHFTRLAARRPGRRKPAAKKARLK